MVFYSIYYNIFYYFCFCNKAYKIDFYTNMGNNICYDKENNYLNNFIYINISIN